MDNIGAPIPPIFAGPYSTPLLITTLGIASTAIALGVYRLIIVKFCLKIHHATPMVSQAINVCHMATGLDENLLKTIPIIAFSIKKLDIFCIEPPECAICLAKLEEREMVRVLPKCMHAFHVICVDEWFVGHANCPICRSPIVAPTDGATIDIDGGTQVETNPHQDGDSRVSASRGLLRHCASMVIGRERRPRPSVTQMTRSLSMDESFLIIYLQRDSSSSSSKFRAPSIRQLDRGGSSNLLTALSQLRARRDNGILPY